MNLFSHFRWVFLLWTFPGVMIHEIAHAEFCRYYKIPVKETCYFQLDDPAGYVVHARPKSYVIAFMISIAPAFVNTGIAFIGGVLLVQLLTPFNGLLTLLEHPPENVVGAFLSAWIGISAGVHALPSRQDAKEIWSQTRENWYNPFVLAVIPVVLLIEVLNRLRPYHFHIVSGVTVFLAGMYIGANTELVIEIIRAYLPV